MKKHYLVLAATLTAFLLLSGCSQTPAEKDSASQGTESQSSAAPENASEASEDEDEATPAQAETAEAASGEETAAVQTETTEAA